MAAMATNSPQLRSSKKTVNEFKFVKEIGNGSYSTVRPIEAKRKVLIGHFLQVFFAVETGTNREFASKSRRREGAERKLSFFVVKAVRKDLITRTKKTSQIFREKEILARLTDCPYSVKLYCTFQDDKTLCKCHFSPLARLEVKRTFHANRFCIDLLSQWRSPPIHQSTRISM